jgi:uncharacterized glyoxalase superfamily protein PhnB
MAIAKQTTATVIPALQWRDYTCKDPEGHVWTFGTYDPWAGH